MLKRTPLFAAHQKLGGKLIEFGGWEMPVQYSSIMDEHLAVRRAAGLFDICHMGEVLVAGSQAAAFLNATLTNDVNKLVVGQGQYTLMCHERGGVIDDLYAYRLAATEFLLVINAARIDADLAWLQARLAAFPARAGVQWRDISANSGAVAVQGPRVAEFINTCFPGRATGGKSVSQVTELQKNELASFDFAGVSAWVSRTGYTGEDGFEIVAPASIIEPIWDRLLALGHPACLQPAGLGARDTLRTEVCYPLYGHELDEQTTPIEAGLGFFVALEKGDFVGRAVLAQRDAQVRRLQDDGKIRPAPAALSDLERRRCAGHAARRSRERHAKPDARRGPWAGLRAARARGSGHGHRNRNSRPARPGRRGGETVLSKTCLTNAPRPDSITPCRTSRTI